jgi:5-methylcytosine-specific restriction endonuclease McrA
MKKNGKKSKPVLRHWLTQKLRRLSYSWPPRKEAIKEARVSRGKYKCHSCSGENFGPKEIQLDHTIPVIDPHTGFTTWDDYIERLFCDSDNFKILCIECHKAKTFRENLIRKSVKTENSPDDDI